GPGMPPALSVQLAFKSEWSRDRLLDVLSRAAALEDQQRPVPQAPQSAYRVLLVEDNQMVGDMFSYGLRKYFRGRQDGVTIDLATDGERAWRMLRDASYDLVIVDFYLPVMNGAELIGRMRGEPRLADLPVVAISVGGVEARRASLEAGADL